MVDQSKYTILRKVADGGTAEIYLAQRDGPKGFQKAVVLKRIKPTLSADPQFRHMLVSEAHVAMGLHHGNIVQVLDLGEAANRYFLVLELVDGWSLDVLVARAERAGLPLPAELALHAVAQVCRALSYAHGLTRDGQPLGIVHRDISPQNVLVSVQGEVKLTDFGIAKAATQSHVTQRGVIKGKVSYMSPEQARAEALDHRSDLFSLGVMLYQLVTGKLPFQAAGAVETLKLIQSCKFASPEKVCPALPGELVRLILTAMQAKPADRFQNAEQMLLAVERVLRGAFPPAGQTELKGWLDELARRDGKLSLLQEWERDCAKKKEPSGEWIMLTSSCAVPLPPPLPPARPKGGGPPAPSVNTVEVAVSVGLPEEAPNRAIRWVTVGAALVVVAGLAAFGALRRGQFDPAQLAPGLSSSAPRGVAAPASESQPLDAGGQAPADVAAVGEASNPSAAPVAMSEESAAADASVPEVAPVEAAALSSEGEAAPLVDQAPVAEPAVAPESAASDARAEADGEAEVAVPPESAAAGPSAPPPAPAPAVARTGEQQAEPPPAGSTPAPAAMPAREVRASAPAAGQKPSDERVVLVISSEPEGAILQVDNREFGRTPITVRFRPGVAYDLTFLKDGYQVTTKRVWVTAGRKEQKVFAFLKREAK